MLFICFTLVSFFVHHLTDILVLCGSCRNLDQATYPLLKKKVFGKKEICKTTQKVCYKPMYFLIGLYYHLLCIYVYLYEPGYDSSRQVFQWQDCFGWYPCQVYKTQAHESKAFST